MIAKFKLILGLVLNGKQNGFTILLSQQRLIKTAI